jgi:plastocyanin
MRLSLRLTGLAVVMVLVAFVATALAAGVKVIKVGDFFFVKDTNHTNTVHVAKGKTVRWKWIGTQDHNVTVIQGPVKFHSRTMDHGTYTKKLTKPGTYLIECTIHGFRMRLVVGS